MRAQRGRGSHADGKKISGFVSTPVDDRPRDPAPAARFTVASARGLKLVSPGGNGACEKVRLASEIAQFTSLIFSLAILLSLCFVSALEWFA